MLIISTRKRIRGQEKNENGSAQDEDIVALRRNDCWRRKKGKEKKGGM